MVNRGRTELKTRKNYYLSGQNATHVFEKLPIFRLHLTFPHSFLDVYVDFVAKDAYTLNIMLF